MLDATTEAIYPRSNPGRVHIDSEPTMEPMTVTKTETRTEPMTRTRMEPRTETRMEPGIKTGMKIRTEMNMEA